MKALTLHQPWASLIAIGAKRIETRAWSTKYRGPLAIHAGGRPPASGLGFVPGRINAVTLLRDSGVLPRRTPSTPASWSECARYLRLGAVVATCRLVDVVPITASGHGWPDGYTSRVGEFPHDGPLDHQQGGLWLVGSNDWTGGSPTRIESERPFGDFSPGRYAWLLADVVPLNPPVAAKGRQGLWEWEEFADAEGAA